jgi:L,D-peptidoglycan transpeptidase YkuD (ErfK/YbiS/YcfS/YnhG family)
MAGIFRWCNALGRFGEKALAREGDNNSPMVVIMMVTINRN